MQPGPTDILYTIAFPAKFAIGDWNVLVQSRDRSENVPAHLARDDLPSGDDAFPPSYFERRLAIVDICCEAMDRIGEVWPVGAKVCGFPLWISSHDEPGTDTLLGRTVCRYDSRGSSAPRRSHLLSSCCERGRPAVVRTAFESASSLVAKRLRSPNASTATTTTTSSLNLCALLS